MFKLIPKPVNKLISADKSKSRNQQYRRFSLGLLGAALVPLFTVGLINCLIDPYGIVKTPALRKFNLLKPVQDDQTRLVKPVEIIQLKPQRVFLGSSRTILGLNPAHGAFRDNLVTYNAGLTGPNLDDIKAYFDHALLNQRDLKEVVLALDFFMFKDADLSSSRTDNQILGKTQIPPLELVRLTLSLDTLASSEKTLEDNLKSDSSETYYFYGMRRASATPDKKDKIDSFKHQINNYLNTFYKDYQLSPNSFQKLQEIIEICRQKNINLKVLVSPIHATQMQTIEAAGLWDDFENWKREVSKITPFFDFATYNQITTEPISNTMKNFSDSAHYTKRVGDLVLNRVFNYRESEVPRDFGVYVSYQNIESHLETVRKNKNIWVKKTPQEVEIVNNIYQQIKK